MDGFHFHRSSLQMTFTEVMKSHSLFHFFHFCLIQIQKPELPEKHESSLIYTAIRYLICYFKGIWFPPSPLSLQEGIRSK